MPSVLNRSKKYEHTIKIFTTTVRNRQDVSVPHMYNQKELRGLPVSENYLNQSMISYVHKYAIRSSEEMISCFFFHRQ